MSGVSRLNNAGDFTLSIVPNALRGGNALQMSNRTNDWHSIEISRELFDLASGDSYSIRIRGTSAAGTTIIVGAPANPFTQLQTAPVAGNGSFDMTVIIAGNDLTARHFNRGLRISSDDTADITIQEIRITRG